MRVFNFRRRKVGGIWFFKLGRLNFLLPLACLLREVTMMLSPHVAELLLPRLFEREAIFLAMESDLSGDAFFDVLVSDRMWRINSMIVRAVEAAQS